MSNFQLVGERRIAAIQAVVSVYEHASTGARHFHMATADDELGFLVAFPTVPDKSDGRAHILEHMVLCGSERYPVRDPFFAMMRRSVATFMNAMTYSSATVYPFSTTDRADYFNLLDVYLDATFFPRLERMSFLQEGWRAEFVDGRYRIQGVVFNEMKGSYSDPRRALYMGLMRDLFPGTNYGVDSGGDPLVIPSLQYEDLREFHRTHYHPSQAVFMSCGRIEARAVQEQIENRVLSRLVGKLPKIVPGLTAPWKAPRTSRIGVPVAQSSESSFGVQLAWRFDDEATPTDRLRFQALSQILSGHDGAPIMRAIHGFGSGRPSGMNGCDTSTRQVVLHVGVEGLREDQTRAASEALLTALKSTASRGVDAASCAAALRSLRFDQRRDRPGLQRLIGLVDAALRGDDIIAAAAFEDALGVVAVEITDPAFVTGHAARVLERGNFLQAEVFPDTDFFSRRQASEQELLQEREAALQPADRATIDADCKELARLQAAPKVGTEVLPRIRPSDVSRVPKPLPKPEFDSRGVWAAEAATNSLTHLELRMGLEPMPIADAACIQLLAEVLPQLGAAGRSYQDAATWRQEQVQDFGVGVQIRTPFEGAFEIEFVMASSALREDQSGLSKVLAAWLMSPDFADLDRLRHLIVSAIQQRAAQLAPAAPQFALTALYAPLSKQHSWDYQARGLGMVDFFGHLNGLLAEPDGITSIQRKLVDMMQIVQGAVRRVVCVGAGADAAKVSQELLETLSSAPSTPDRVKLPAEDAPQRSRDNIAVIASAQTNSCAMAWSVPRMTSPEAPALAVAAELLTQLFLHTAVREKGGAYGVGAVYDPINGTFAMRSMSDPRLEATFRDFEAAVEQLGSASIDEVAFEEAVLSVLKKLDQPLLPLSKSRTSYENSRIGVHDDLRLMYREGVLTCDLSEVRRVAIELLDIHKARRGASARSADLNLDGLKALDLVDFAERAGLVK